MKQRYLFHPIEEHLRTLRQMVFLMGPRQVGKTTLSQSLLSPVSPGINYFNWDMPEHRKILLRQIFPGTERLEGEAKKIVVFDEIHKYPRWKNSLKGLFDTHEPKAHWVVTGSAMLNIYRRGQDSLMGRYFSYHLSPFSVSEITQPTGRLPPLIPELLKQPFEKANQEGEEALKNLIHLGGFPEPLFKNEESFLSRWRTSRLDRLINQDLAVTEMLRNLPLVENLMLLLPERVGSLLSLNSLREDLEVHFATVRHWMELLERVFYGFFLRPYATRTARMLKKEAKWYLWDWTEIEDLGARFENLVAVHIKKYIDFVNERGQDSLSLHYVRDKQKREVDFLVCRERKPFLLVECKLNEKEPAPSLGYFAKILGVHHALQVLLENRDPLIRRDGEISIRVVSAASFLGELI